MRRRLLAALMAIGFVGGLAACNTIEGLGKDISSGARTVKRTISGN